MSLPKAPKPAKLVIGLFMKEKGLIEQITAELIEVFGSIDMVSPWLPFNYTDYYESEMNAPLFRRMLTFKELIKQSSLVLNQIVCLSDRSLLLLCFLKHGIPLGYRLSLYC
ncbi:hypothetical protein ES705_42248 [subsurface metagenome]